jgi:hypothetical protein
MDEKTAHWNIKQIYLHDENLTVNTLVYAQLLYEIISLQNIIMSKKRTFTYTGVPTLFVDFLSTPALAWNQENLSERRDMATHGLSFQWTSTYKKSSAKWTISSSSSLILVTINRQYNAACL